MDRHDALSRLETSRLCLMEQVVAYEGSESDVLNEINGVFGDLDVKKRVESETDCVENGIVKRRTVNGIRFCLNRLNWQKCIGVAVKMLMVTSAVQFYQSRVNSGRRIVSNCGDRLDTQTVLTLSKNPLDVFYGRG